MSNQDSHKQIFNDEDKLSNDIFLHLRHAGYLFPSTDEEVKNFEKFINSDDIEIPEHITNTDELFKKIQKYSEKHSNEIKMAAFISPKNITKKK
jgi:hypothetical protein